MRRAERKVPGGKLVQMTCVDGAVRLTGDFFLHPEDALPDLESFLSTLAGDRDAMARAIGEHIERSGIRLIGLRPEDLVDLLAEVRT